MSSGRLKQKEFLGKSTEKVQKTHWSSVEITFSLQQSTDQCMWGKELSLLGRNIPKVSEDKINLRFHVAPVLPSKA